VGEKIAAFAPLCKQTEENNNHHFVHCRFTVIMGAPKRLARSSWNSTSDWAGLEIQHWWSGLTEGSSHHRKGLASLALLIVWEIWQERNARIFRKKLSNFCNLR
jgi:hypothetical protein